MAFVRKRFRLEEGIDAGKLKLIAFDVSADGDLTRRGSHTAGGATEINVANLSSSRIVTAVREAGGDLKVIVFDLAQDGTFTRRGSWEDGAASHIDLAKISSSRVAPSIRDGSGNLKVILFDINWRGDVARGDDYEGNPVSDLADLTNLQLTTSFPATSITALTLSRLVVTYRDPFIRRHGGNLHVLTLGIDNDALSLEGTDSYEGNPAVAFIKPINVSAVRFATIVQLDGQIWTGKRFSLLGTSFVHLDPYTKLKLGWLPYTEINADGAGAIFAMGSPVAEAVIIQDPNHRETEYFIVEARSRDSLYERSLPCEGLAIWHIDEERDYPRPFVSLEWLGASPETACWDPENPVIENYNDSSSPAGSRWSDFSRSGISISQVESFWGIVGFQVDFE